MISIRNILAKKEEIKTSGSPLKKQSIHREAFYALLEGNVEVVTGSGRLAREILTGYEQRMRASHEVWRTPSIRPFTPWLVSLWEETTLDGVFEKPSLLLSEPQELKVWEWVVERCTPTLLRSDAAAADAMAAWHLMIAWQLPASASIFGYNEDSQAFWSWQEKFDIQCRRNHWLSPVLVAELLVDALNNGWSGTLSDLLLTGFDEFTPQQQVLIAALQQAGYKVRWMEPADAQGRVVRSSWRDTRVEIDAACRWARGRLQANPEARIGLVALDLGAARGILERRLDANLAPERQAFTLREGRQRPWNISLGLPLVRYPLVRLALQILHLLESGRLPVREMTELLCAPDLTGAEQEAGARALLDGRLREQGESEVTLRSLASRAGQEDRSWYCPELLNAVHRVLQVEGGGRHPADYWARCFGEWLLLFGWAGGRPLDSKDYQTVQAWNGQLLALGSLSQVSEALSAEAALLLLRRLSSSTMFQAQSPRASVQVLGLYEAIGLEFDHLWIMGLHDNAWPPTPRPNPFLPLPLQRQRFLPRSGRVRELQVAQRLTRRLLGAAKEVVVSYPLTDGEAALRPSPLLDLIREAGEPELGLELESDWGGWIREHGEREMFLESAPPLEGSSAPGGSRLFELQAQCPFRAFAELRLGARLLVEPGLGLDAMQRGTLLHRSLERLWEELDGSERLALLNSEGRKMALGEAVGAALAEAARKYPRTLRGRFLELERLRLMALLEKWLEVEGRRPRFHVIQREERFQVRIGGIDVVLRIDRLDRLEDGSELVIDYKSGRVAPGEWFGARPEKPQLPLYAVALEGDDAGFCDRGRLVGVLYGQLRTGELGFKGVAELNRIETVPGNARQPLSQACAEWPAVVREWRQALERLAEEYRNGEAGVDPKLGLQTCRKSHCDLAMLCRVHERAGEGAGIEMIDDRDG